VIVRAGFRLYHVTYQLGNLNLLTNVIQQCMENSGLRIIKRSYYKTVSYFGIRIDSIQCTTYVELCIATDTKLDINELSN
jgi:hypothetical protein